jgi:PAS domain S-box-containing protein
MRAETNNQTTILLVDDTPGSIGVVQAALEEAGYRVAIATSGEKALQRAALVMPDLILLDVLMPGMDGYETCRQLKAQEATRDFPVIFLSGLTETIDKVKGLEVGAVDYLIKPIATEELLARVRTHVTISRLERELQASNRTLEERVAARTAEVNATNKRLMAEIEERKRTGEALRQSEQRFRAIFDQTFQFIGVLTIEGILLQANQTALQFAGVGEEPVLGKPFWQTPWWAHSAELQQRLQAAVREAAGGKLVRFEATHTMPDGQIRYLDFSLKPITDAEGRVFELLPEGRDITERKQSEEALRESRQRLDNIVANSPGAIYRCANDPNWTMEFLSAAITQITGYPAEDFLNNRVRSYASIIHPDDRRRVEQAVAAGLEHRDRYEIDYRLIAADGHLRWVHEQGRGVFAPEGGLLCLDGLLFDITAQRRTEEALRLNAERTDALLQLNQMASATLDEITSFAFEAAIRLTRSRLAGLPGIRQRGRDGPKNATLVPRGHRQAHSPRPAEGLPRGMRRAVGRSRAAAPPHHRQRLQRLQSLEGRHFGRPGPAHPPHECSGDRRRQSRAGCRRRQ